RLAAKRHPANQGVVADHIDGSRDSGRILVNARNGLAAEYVRGLTARLPNPARNVGARLSQVEGLELASQRHTLLQLPKVRLFEPCSQLRLPREDQREELGRMCFDIRKETNLLEQFEAEALGLVDHERRDLAARVTFSKEPLETLEQERLRLAGFGTQVEFERKQPHEVVRANDRIIQVDAPD